MESSCSIICCVCSILPVPGTPPLTHASDPTTTPTSRALYRASHSVPLLDDCGHLLAGLLAATLASYDLLSAGQSAVLLNRVSDLVLSLLPNPRWLLLPEQGTFNAHKPHRRLSLARPSSFSSNASTRGLQSRCSFPDLYPPWLGSSWLAPYPSSPWLNAPLPQGFPGHPREEASQSHSSPLLLSFTIATVPPIRKPTGLFAVCPLSLSVNPRRGRPLASVP